MEHTVVGIDVGSVSVSLVRVDSKGKVVTSISEPHFGAVEKTLKSCMQRLQVNEQTPKAVTSSTPAILPANLRVNNLVAAIRAVRRLHPRARALLLVGGEKFSLTLFREDGSYLYSRTNTLCAAGTGSFLDQQARRLGLSSSAELARLALQNRGERPRIATRCAVFAKTDLIHAQQEGYSLSAICDGLCRGLAANIHDTLFAGENVLPPVVFAGGVALNQATRRHLEELCGTEMVVDELAPFYCAYGAALELLEKGGEDKLPVFHPIVQAKLDAESRAYYPPLDPVRGQYPDFSAHRHYLFQPRQAEKTFPVEVDDYRPVSGAVEAWLGIDIGSTSTKAVLLDHARPGAAVLAGFYTRTAGRPLEAVQALFEAICHWAEENGCRLAIQGVATTGSGRKFIGVLVGADLVLDEISAHARAAVELDPAVDTIIEIGGQDAKFTSLNSGVVTLSIMNNVCAAGTGSFIEEQARRLDCPLEQISQRTLGRRAPLASDRCTVFMERDLNQFLADGYHPDEVMCAVLHAVRDNYLLKVARDGHIGERIWFQGATAKCQALVSAFEQKLGRPINVSLYCHLTGALGAALELREQARQKGSFRSTFRGLEIYRQRIPVSSEVCELCHNHCKLRLVEVNGEKIGFGYLCGRDPQQTRFVSANRSGFDLLAERRKHFAFERAPLAPGPIIGLPAALHLVEDLPLWKRFFHELGLRVVTSEGLQHAAARGKQLAGAEFCAPIAAWHAHLHWLAQKVDFVFAPYYLEAEHPPGQRSQFCYYTQYSPALAAFSTGKKIFEKCLLPLLRVGKPIGEALDELERELKKVFAGKLDREMMEKAFRTANQWYQQRREALRELMQRNLPPPEELAVVLIGRPYTVLSPDMNAGIPEIFGRLGVRVFYQDMLPLSEDPELEELIGKTKWYHSRRTLRAAWEVARLPGLYPVLLTSFKCTPDACTLEYFRRIMDRHQKPFLVLQLDEHDSRVGYETRIEAALRAFSNHHRGQRPKITKEPLPLVPKYTRSRNHTIFVPDWDKFSTRLFVAGLRQTGIDARLLEEDAALIRSSLGHNTGQCLPLSIVVSEFVETVRRHGLDPSKTALWLPLSSIACNICFFPQYAKALLERIGGGFEKASIYAGEVTCHEISPAATLNAFHAFTFGGMLRRLVCRVRPYEKRKGETDRAAGWALELLEQAMLGARPKRQTVKQVVDAFLQIDRQESPRPLVAIFGDLYCRDNDVFNQDLIRLIEQHGGEVLTTPYSEYIHIISGPYLRKWLREGNWRDFLLAAPFALSFDWLEYPYRREYERLLGKRVPIRQLGKTQELLARFGVTMYHTGESFDNLLKIFHLLERYPEISLFVQTNPAFCCPSLVTEAMAARIEEFSGVPVVTVTYDGTTTRHNEVIIPYLQLACEKENRAKAAAVSGSK